MFARSLPRLAVSLFLGSFAVCTAARACTIPVFRYALDRWESDRFRLLLPQETAAQPTMVDLLRPLRAGGRANLDIQTDRAGRVTAPTLYFPGHEATPVWSGRMDAPALAALLDSPAREEIRRHILSGSSVIWVLVDAATPAEDATAERIRRRLAFLEQAAALPIQDPNDPDSQLGPGPPLKLQFQTLRLSLGDPAEGPLLAMLAGPEKRVDASKPFAAAVFGRGRVLGSWPLSALDDAALEDACMFLIGRCSCRVKNQNPGWDILMEVDWEGRLRQASQGAVTSATVPASAPAAAPPPPAPPALPEVTRIQPPESPPAAEASSRRPWLVGAGAAVLLLALVLWLRPS